MVTPKDNSQGVLVVGGGVAGLVTAWTLLDRGHQVTILSDKWALYDSSQRLTSQIAGALWEYPPAVCGSHTNEESLSRSKEWCMTSYRIFDAMARDANISSASGVRMTRSAFFFPYNIIDSPKEMNKFLETCGSGVRGVRDNRGLIEELGVDGTCGAIDAYECLAPVIDTDVGMSWLMDLVEAKGGVFVTGRVTGDLLLHEDALLRRYGAAAIVNATGLASRELAGDESCYPLRGALLRVINDGSDFPKITTAMSIAADAAVDNEIGFLVPRDDNILIIGGIAQPNESLLDLTLDSPVIKRMETRCKDFLPTLRNAGLDPNYPLAQGLRPAHKENIRLEREPRITQNGKPSRIVHCHGHGGSGWSLSFGCAEEVAALVSNILAEKLTRDSIGGNENWKRSIRARL